MKILLIEPQKAPITIGGEDVFLYEPLLNRIRNAYRDYENLESGACR